MSSPSDQAHTHFVDPEDRKVFHVSKKRFTHWALSPPLSTLPRILVIMMESLQWWGDGPPTNTAQELSPHWIFTLQSMATSLIKVYVKPNIRLIIFNTFLGIKSVYERITNGSVKMNRYANSLTCDIDCIGKFEPGCFFLYWLCDRLISGSYLFGFTYFHNNSTWSNLESEKKTVFWSVHTRRGTRLHSLL